MKYRKQLATGALALSLLVSGSTIYAASPQDLGIRNFQKNYQKHGKENLKTKKQGAVGTVSDLTNSGFTLNVINLKTKVVSSVDVKTDATTLYKKDGVKAVVTDLLDGQKVIVTGALDKTANVLNAKTVKIVTKDIAPKLRKEVKKLNKTD